MLLITCHLLARELESSVPSGTTLNRQKMGYLFAPDRHPRGSNLIHAGSQTGTQCDVEMMRSSICPARSCGRVFSVRAVSASAQLSPIDEVFDCAKSTEVADTDCNSASRYRQSRCSALPPPCVGDREVCWLQGTRDCHR